MSTLLHVTVFLVSASHLFAAESSTQKDNKAPEATAFDAVFTPPHLLMGDSLVRASHEGEGVFLKNASSVRSLKSGSDTQSYWGLGRVDNGDRDAWKDELLGLRPIYRSTFFAQPWSDESTEFWLETQEFPFDKKFDDDNVMKIQSAVRFERKERLQFRFVDYNSGIFVLCAENYMDNKRPELPKNTLVPLDCASVNREFCANAQRPLRKETILGNMLKKDDAIDTLAVQSAALVTEKVFKYWKSVDTSFRGMNEEPPKINELKKLESFSSLEIGIFDKACDLFLVKGMSSHKKIH